ncbi:GNAT family N-acetyltransferase [Streptomyces sp. WM6372]|uniref:GNAT family N-acetyltransferase n=1 Tax=Streptomyces sp. WM6372 TaxID=1415555 RepID=UPI0006AF90CF|nr:GNAT family N-acetyltransferase [Streptomyces sp. WM6372]
MSFIEPSVVRSRSGRTFLLRELDLTDAAMAVAVQAVGRRAYAVEADLIGFSEIPALRETLQELRAEPLRWAGALTDDGQLAAFVAWQHLAPGDDIDVHRMCVDPAWFRQGLASELVAHLLTEWMPSGDVLVSTGADNLPAVALYERLGFSRVGTSEPAPGLRMAEFRLKR